MPAECDGSGANRILFVGNARGARRKVIDDALTIGLDIKICGFGWEKRVDENLILDTWIPNDRLNEYYRSAAIILNDHWPSMKANGFISNRVFDVIASGGFVITDDIADAETVFRGALPVYKSLDDLRQQCEEALLNPQDRQRRVERLRELVVKHHTFDCRATVILDKLDSLARRVRWMP